MTTKTPYLDSIVVIVIWLFKTFRMLYRVSCINSNIFLKRSIFDWLPDVKRTWPRQHASISNYRGLPLSCSKWEGRRSDWGWFYGMASRDFRLTYMFAYWFNIVSMWWDKLSRLDIRWMLYFRLGQRYNVPFSVAFISASYLNRLLSPQFSINSESI